MRDEISNRWRQAKKCLDLVNSLRKELSSYASMLAADGRPVRSESSEGICTLADAISSQMACNEALLKSERDSRNAIYYGYTGNTLRATFTNGKDYKTCIVNKPDESCDIPYIPALSYEVLCRLFGTDDFTVSEGFDVFVMKSGGKTIRGKV